MAVGECSAYSSLQVDSKVKFIQVYTSLKDTNRYHMASIRTKFPLARQVTSQHDSTRCRDERVARVEPCCSNMVDDEQAIVLACKV